MTTISAAAAPTAASMSQLLPLQSHQSLRGLSDYHSSSSSLHSADHLYSPNVWWFVLALAIVLLFAVFRVYIGEALANRRRWGSVQSRKKHIRSMVVAKTVIADTDPKASKYLSQPTFESAVSSLEEEEEEPTKVVTPPPSISPEYVPNPTTATSQAKEPNTMTTAPPAPEDINSSTKSNPRILQRKKTNLVVHENHEHHSANKDHQDDSSATGSLQDDDGDYYDDTDDKVDDDDYDSLACQICLNRFQVGDKICWSHNPECVHTFHMDCLEHWLLDKDHCPLCRQPYLVVPEVEDTRVAVEEQDIETGGIVPAVHSEETEEGVAVTCRLIPFAALVDRLSAIPRHHCHTAPTGSGNGSSPDDVSPPTPTPTPDTSSADTPDQQHH